MGEQVKCIVLELLEKLNWFSSRYIPFFSRMELVKYSMSLVPYLIKNKRFGGVMGFISLLSPRLQKSRGLWNTFVSTKSQPWKTETLSIN